MVGQVDLYHRGLLKAERGVGVMSTRDSLIAIRSIQQIQQVVGSKDQSLFDLIQQATEDDLKRDFGAPDQLEGGDLEVFEEQLETANTELNRMIMDAKPPAAEPGYWIFIIQRLIKLKDLAVPLNFTFNKGYKHWYAWEPYREAIVDRLTKPALEALQHLEKGRPLRGKKIDHDGCLFAWLTQPEIADLYDSLAKISASNVGNADLEEFHQDVVDALALLKKEQCDLVLSAY